MSTHNAYDVPEERHPNKKVLTKETSKVNSPVNGFKEATNKPTQNPIHIGQWNISPKPAHDADAGRWFLKMLPYTKICVIP